MEQFWLEPALTLLLVLTVIVFCRAKSRHHSPHLPPGPFAWPVVGNLLQLGTEPPRSLAKLSAKYGPLMRLKLGSVETVIISSPAMAKDVFQTYDHVTSSRPKLISAIHNGMNVGLAPMGPGWRKRRKVIMSELLNSGRIASFQRVRKEEIFSSLNSIFQASSTGRVIQVKQMLFEFTFNVITRMLTSKKYFGAGIDINLGEAEEFQHCIDDFFKVGSFFDIGDFIPSLRRFDLQGHEKQYRAMHTRFDKLLQAIIDDHRTSLHTKQADKSGCVDFVDAVLKLHTQHGQRLLSDFEIRAIMMDVLFGGTDTQVTTLEWTLTELFRHPEELRKVQEELDRVVGRERLVEELDIPSLPYLRNVLKETFRIHPTGPLMIPHESIEACKISSYDIPAKTRIICNLWAIGRDTTIWGEDVEEFRPQRFEKLPNVDWKGHNFEFIPFGAGRRICPGLELADLQMQYILAQWLHAFSWALPYGQDKEDIDMVECYGAITKKSVPLELVATPRLQPDVYKVSNIDIGVC